MKRLIGATALGCALLLPAASDASIIGAPVDGSLVFSISGNGFDPALGFVPAGFGNSASADGVIVADPLVEFGYHSEGDTGVGFGVLDVTADFTAHQLTVTYSPVGDFDILSPWTMTFSSPAFAGLTVSEVSDTLGVTVTREGSAIELEWPAEFPPLSPGEIPTVVLDLRPVPEPASLLMLGAGFAAAVWRRRAAR